MARPRRLLVLLLACCALLAAPATAGAHAGHPHPQASGALPAPAHEDTIQEINFDFAGVVEDAAPAMASTAAATLPLTWCGTEKTVDDTANAVHAAALPQFKLVYAYSTDRPNRFAQWR